MRKLSSSLSSLVKSTTIVSIGSMKLSYSKVLLTAKDPTLHSITSQSGTNYVSVIFLVAHSLQQPTGCLLCGWTIWYISPLTNHPSRRYRTTFFIVWSNDTAPQRSFYLLPRIAQLAVVLGSRVESKVLYDPFWLLGTRPKKLKYAVGRSNK